MILEVIIFLFPAYMANMAPVICKKLPILNYPIDYHKTWNNKRILGDHKTWRGLFTGIIFATLTTLTYSVIQHHDWFSSYALMSYNAWYLIGPALGFGALAGDALESVLKRQLSIGSGKPLYVLDQLDFVIGALVAGLLFTTYTLPFLFAALLFSFVADVAVNHIAYALKIRGERW